MAEITLGGSGGGGGFFGGLAGGISDAQTQMLAQQKQKALEQNQVKTDATTQITATIGHIRDVIKANADAGNDPSKVVPSIQGLMQSARNLAQLAGMDPSQVDATVQTLLARPAVETEGKKKIVTTSGGLGEPDRMHVFDESKGTLSPIDPKTGQPMLSPSETISPRQAAAANPPPAPVAAAATQPGAPAPIPQQDSALPPGASPVQAIESRFVTPPSDAAPINHNVNYDAIAHLPPGVQAKIKGVADGTIDIKNFSQRLGKNGQSPRDQVLEIVKQYDPSFDTASAPARAATLKAFKSGVEARKLSALGTVVGHIAELKKEGEALDNWKSDTFSSATKAANAIRLMIQEGKQTPAITRFDNSATAVSNELENAFRGNTTAISGIMEWRKTISAGMASDQIAESTKSLGKLLLARMSELKEQWDRGMGHNQDPSIAMKLLSTRGLLEKMSAGTLFSDRTESINKPDIAPLKSKYGLQ